MAHCKFCLDILVSQAPYVDVQVVDLKAGAERSCRACILVYAAYEHTLLSANSATSTRLRLSKEVLGNPSLVVSHEGARIALCELNEDGAIPQGADDEVAAAVEFIHKGMQRCLSAEHEVCTRLRKDLERNRGAWNPTRLLRIDASLGTIALRLVRTAILGGAQRYVALSHCWGKYDLITTTHLNYRRHEASIVWDTLSKTFQDAITVTIALGLKYIWIDSLCIIQGDKEDWAREAATMCNVYRLAELTISATGAVDGTVGLFQKRSWPDLTQSGRGNINGSKTEYALYTTQQHTPLHLLHGMGSYERTPLLTRAWCLQEQLLSPNVVHFTTTELVFECALENVCECLLFSHPTLKQGTAPLFRDAAQRRKLWPGLIGEYTNRKLSHQEDRLAAISGIVAALPSSHDHPLDYVAGLFKANLPTCLLWMSKYGEGKRPTMSRFSSPPSWSWASVECGMIWWASWMTRDDRENEARVKILDIQCTPATADPFGCVIGGRLHVRGLIFVLKWMPLGSTQKARFLHMVKDNAGASVEVMDASVTKDVHWEELDQPVAAGESLYFLPMVNDSGLMLQKLVHNTPNDHQSLREVHFSRIAYAYIKPADISYGQCMDLVIV